MNSYDSDRLLESVESTHKQVDCPESADVIVFNTCHIREKAAEKIYSELGKIKEIKKNIRLVKKLPKAKGFSSILYPGERKNKLYKKNLNRDISVPKKILIEMDELNVV